MLALEGNDLGIQFMQQWIFRGLAFQLAPGDTMAIVGPNGSGKTTLLRMLAGQLSASQGQLRWHKHGHPLAQEQVYRHLSWTGPFLELYPDLQLEEAVRLHFRFKRCLLAGPRACLAALYLEQHRGKKLAYFSSGMLQRLKLGMALFSDSSLLLLDEPTSFMDPQNTQFALQLLADYRKGRTLVLASNIPAEYQRFARQLQLTQAAG